MIRPAGPGAPSGASLLTGLETLRGCTLTPPRRLRLAANATAGTHRVRRRGGQDDFTGFRPYQPGDPVRDIDWGLYGRTDRLYLRQREDTSDLTLHLLLDASASMAFAGWPARLLRGDAASSPTTGRQTHKLHHAAAVAALLGAVALRQRDRVFARIHTNGQVLRLPPLRGGAGGGRSGAAAHLANRLAAATAVGGGALGAPVRDAVSSMTRRSVLVVLTDGLSESDDQDAAFLDAVRDATRRGHAAVVVQVLHPHELEPPAGPRRVRVVDSETGRRVRVAGDWRAAYRDATLNAVAGLSAGVHAAGGHHLLSLSDRPPAATARAVCEHRFGFAADADLGASA